MVSGCVDTVVGGAASDVGAVVDSIGSDVPLRAPRSSVAVRTMDASEDFRRLIRVPFASDVGRDFVGLSVLIRLR